MDDITIIAEVNLQLNNGHSIGDAYFVAEENLGLSRGEAIKAWLPWHLETMMTRQRWPNMTFEQRRAKFKEMQK